MNVKRERWQIVIAGLIIGVIAKSDRSHVVL